MGEGYKREGVIDLGHGIRLMTVSRYANAFGITRVQTIHLFECLRVPLVRLGNRDWVNHTTVQLAVCAMTVELGRANFWATGNTKHKEMPEGWVDSLDPDTVDVPLLLSYILAGGRLNLLQPDSKFARQLRRSFTVLNATASELQKRHMDGIRAEAERQGVIEPIPKETVDASKRHYHITEEKPLL